MNHVQIKNADCLIEMKNIPDKSIDMILCDLPYGTTACKWDVVIPFEPLWKEYKRIIKDRGCIALFGSEPFSSYLRMSNIKDYKYDWIWNKKKGGNIFLSKYQPNKITEIISIFNAGLYFPIMEKRDKIKTSKNYGTGETMGGNRQKENKLYTYTHRYPKNIIEISNADQKGKQHPTAKPVSLLEYLIKTYTLENEAVLDNCMGSGSTGVACINTNRNFIGIEKDETYFKIAEKRIDEAQEKKKELLFA
jgi:site-specific DNA-methyltransferase (adenine-specific)